MTNLKYRKPLTVTREDKAVKMNLKTKTKQKLLLIAQDKKERERKWEISTEYRYIGIVPELLFEIILVFDF